MNPRKRSRLVERTTVVEGRWGRWVWVSDGESAYPARTRRRVKAETTLTWPEAFSAPIYFLKEGRRDRGEFARERRKKIPRAARDKKSAHCIRPRLLSEYLSFIKASSLNLSISIKSLSAMHPLSWESINRMWDAINSTTEVVWFFVCGLCVVWWWVIHLGHAPFVLHFWYEKPTLQYIP